MDMQKTAAGSGKLLAVCISDRRGIQKSEVPAGRGLRWISAPSERTW